MIKGILTILKYTWAPLVVLSIIFYLCCLIPVSDIPKVAFDFPIPTDKIAHFLMFGGLALTASVNYIFVKKKNINIAVMLLFVIVPSIVLGGLIEVVQDKYYINRSGDWIDFIADTLGVLASIPFALWFRHIILKRNREERETR